MIELILIALLFILTIYLLIKNLEWRWKFEKKLKEEIEKKKEEIRADAIKRSSSILVGKSVEKLIPISKKVEYDARDFRWLGDPIDYVVFNGLAENDLKEIVFLEVKSGEAELNERQKKIKEIIEKKKIRWKEIKV